MLSLLILGSWAFAQTTEAVENSPVTVFPTSLTFASCAVGTTSGPRKVTLTNHLNTSLSVSPAVATGGFAVASNACGASVGPGLSCTLGVTFTPTEVGLRTGTLTLPYRASGSPSVVALSGAGNANGLISIVVTPANPSIALGQTQQFTATGYFRGGSTQNLTASVLWNSSAPGVATINGPGLVSSVSPGSTTITPTFVTITPLRQATGVTPGTPIINRPPTSPISGSTTLTVTAGFLYTGSLTTGRDHHTATLLNNGTVLIAGGLDSTGYVSTSAEVYSPTTGTLSPTGSLNTARWYHTATLLNNGMVLMAGGSNEIGNALASAELYNPATGTFSYTTGSPNTGRAGHTATLLNNGMVLMAGGGNSSSGALASAELYNPTTGTFAPTGSLNTARDTPKATLLNNGMVLIAGGYTISPTAGLASAELYNPATGAFTATGSLNTTRNQHTATLLNNGMVLMAGGYGAGGYLASAELYDPATETFTPTGSLNTARWSHTATLLNNGTVLIAGGENSSGSLANAELYNPTTGTFTPTGSLNTPRAWHTATLLDNGTVLVAGGYNSSSGNILGSAELYLPATLTPPDLESIAITPATPTREQRADRGLGDFGRRRTAGDVIIHLNHLVERAHHVPQLRQGKIMAVVLPFERGPGLGVVDHRRRFLIDVAEDLLARELVGQTGDAAQVGAGAVGNQILALAAEQAGHLLLLAGADGAIEQRRHNGLVRHRLHIGLLEVHRAGPQHNVNRLDHAKDVFREVHDSFFTAAAGSAPVEAYFGF